MHPQTLRIYERRGLVNPARTQGGNRRYSDADIEVLRRIAELAEEGMNLEGIRRVMQLEAEDERLRAELAESRDAAAPGGQRGRSAASAATSSRCARRWPCSASARVPPRRPLVGRRGDVGDRDDHQAARPRVEQRDQSQALERQHRAGFEAPAAAACTRDRRRRGRSPRARRLPVRVDVRAPVARGDRDDAP